MNQSISDYDQYLSQGKFGSEEAILTDTATIYNGLLRLLHYHTAYDLTDFLHNPVPEIAICTRRIIDRAFMLLSSKRKDDALKEIEWLSNNINDVVLSLTQTDNKTPLLFDNTNVFKSNIAQRLNTSFKRDGFDGVKFIKPTTHQQEILNSSFQLLDRFLPKVIKSSFAFIKGFTVVETGFESAYNREAPQIFLINVDVIVDPLLTAEFLLHESLHQKMNDLQVTRPIIVDSYDDFASHERGDVTLPWGVNKPRPFSLVRAIATYHVYVHLSVLYKLALLRIKEGEKITGFTESKIQKRFLNAYNRARYIQVSLLKKNIVKCYNDEGKAFINWLQKVLVSIAEDKYMNNLISSKPLDFYE